MYSIKNFIRDKIDNQDEAILFLRELEEIKKYINELEEISGYIDKLNEIKHLYFEYNKYLKDNNRENISYNNFVSELSKNFDYFMK